MANDIEAINTGLAIKNAISVVHIPNSGGAVSGTAYYQTLETDVINTPVIADIESKYDTRFNDVSYY